MIFNDRFHHSLWDIPPVFYSDIPPCLLGFHGFSSIFTGIHAVIQALAYAFTLTQPGPAAGPANVTDRRLGQALPFWVKKHGWFLQGTDNVVPTGCRMPELAAEKLT